MKANVTVPKSAIVRADGTVKRLTNEELEEYKNTHVIADLVLDVELDKKRKKLSRKICLNIGYLRQTEQKSN